MRRTSPADQFQNFAVQSYLSFLGLFGWLTPWSYTSNMFIAPFINVTLFALVTRYATGRGPSQDLIVGTAILALSSMVNGGILQSFTYERSFGTLAVVLASPANRMAVYWSRGAMHYANGLLAACVALTATVLVFRLDVRHTNLPALILALLLGGSACVASALFIGNFSMIFRNWLILYGAAQSSMLALTGAVIPRSQLPAPLGFISSGLPLTHSISVARAAFRGAPLSAVSGDLVREALVAVCFGLAGGLAYRWIESRARARGEFYE